MQLKLKKSLELALRHCEVAMVSNFILWGDGDLPARSFQSYPGHQRPQFLPLCGTGPLCPFCPCFHNANRCILGGWPLCVEYGLNCSSGFILTYSTLA